eukprot:1033085-Rhodomonas_salina.1
MSSFLTGGSGEDGEEAARQEEVEEAAPQLCAAQGPRQAEDGHLPGQGLQGLSARRDSVMKVAPTIPRVTRASPPSCTARVSVPEGARQVW